VRFVPARGGYDRGVSGEVRSARADARRVMLGLVVMGVGLIYGAINVAILTEAGLGNVTLTGGDRLTAVVGIVVGLVAVTLGNVLIQKVRIARHRSGLEHSVGGILADRNR
jgi:hypothetical protein